MVKEKGIFSGAATIIKEAKDKQKKAKQERAKIPFGVKLWNFVVTWGLRMFFTAFFLVFSYLLILVCTSMIPAFANIVFSGLEFDFDTWNEIVLGILSGGFLAAWIFTLSYKLVKFAGKLYIKGMRNTIKNATERLDDKTTNQ